MRTSRMRIELIEAQKHHLEVAKEAGATEGSLEGNSLVVSCRPEDRLRILRALDSGKGIVLQFATEQLSIEDIYMGHVKNGNKSTDKVGFVGAPQ